MMRAVVIAYDIPDIEKPYVDSDETVMRPWDERKLNALIFTIRQQIRKGLQEKGHASVMVDIR